MEVLSARHSTLADVVGRMNSDGSINQIVEVLSEKHEELKDIVFVQANGITDHLTTVRAGLPDVAWRKLYKGLPNSKSSVVSVRNTMGKIGVRAQIDEDLLNLNGVSAWPIGVMRGSFTILKSTSLLSFCSISCAFISSASVHTSKIGRASCRERV